MTQETPAVRRAFEILEYLGDRRGATLSEIARDLGLPKNSAQRILFTLVRTGYAALDGREYSLSPQLFRLGSMSLHTTRLRDKALPLMHELCSATRETVLLGVPLGDRGIVIEQVITPEPIKITVDIGTRFHLHSAAPGKIFLAFLPESERREMLDKIQLVARTDQTITDRARLEEVLNTVREEGVAYDLGEDIEGLRCLAAPIFNYAGEIVASIWLSGPRFRLEDAALAEMKPLVIEAGRRLSQAMGADVEQIR